MNEPLIRDSAFSGSPIMSYGQFSARHKWPKLLALAAGSFALLVLGVSIWFWFFSTLPLPAQSAVMAIIPPGYKMPSGVPGVWREAVEHNYPLPTVVGLWAAGQPGDQLSPFAVQVLDFTGHQDDGWNMWRVVSQSSSSAVELTAPYKVFGNPWSDKGSLLWLSIRPAKVLNMGKEADLPPVLQGYVQNGTWKVEAPPEQLADQEPDWSTNYLSLSSVKNNYLANFTAFYGQQRFGAQDWVHWEHDDGLTLTFKPVKDSELSLASQTLTVGSILLPDDYLVQIFEVSDLAPYATRTQPDSIKYNLPYVTGIYTSSSAGDLGCQGQRLAAFDEQSLKNICSWSDICYIKLKSLVINRQEQYINFCFN